MKRDAQFEKELCKMFDSVQQVQAIQMEQLRENIELLRAANKSEVDIDKVALQILDTPISLTGCLAKEITPAQPTIHLNDEMVCTAEPQIKDGELGNLRNLSYVKNDFEKEYGKDFYHHCQDVEYNLVGLIESKLDRERICPQCGNTFRWM